MMELPRSAWEVRFSRKLMQLVPNIRREMIRQIAANTWDDAGDLTPEVAAQTVAENIDDAILATARAKK